MASNETPVPPTRSSVSLPMTPIAAETPPRSRSYAADVEKLVKAPEKFKMPDTSTSLESEAGTPTHHYGEEDYELHRHVDLNIHKPLSHVSRKSSSGHLTKSSSKGRLQPGSKSMADNSVIESIPEVENEGRNGYEGEMNDGSRPDIPKFTIGDPDVDDDIDDTVPFDVGVTEGSSSVVPTIVIKDEDNQEVERTDTPHRKHQHKHHHHHHHGDREHKHHHHHHKHHHHRPHMDPEDLKLRSQQGSHVDLGRLVSNASLPTEVDEARMLNTVDLEEMTMHRLGDMPGMSRHKVSKNMSSFIHIAPRNQSVSSDKETREHKKVKKKKKQVHMKKEIDHRPHEVFIELDELYKEEGHDMQWKEKARWIKFEENVEEGAKRWGKPHVASLSFHSLVELRNCLECGTCLLDLEEVDLHDIFQCIVDKMVSDDQFNELCRDEVMKTLLLKHKHGKDKGGMFRNLSGISLNTEKSAMRKMPTEPANLGDVQNDDVHIPMLSPEVDDLSRMDLNMEVMYKPNLHSSHSFARPHTKRLDQQRLEGIMKKIPEDAEATTVLVGELDMLTRPAVAFVRLAQGTKLGGFTEVPIPVRFLFVVLGPTGSEVDYYEIGRSFSTLMSNEHFHQTAYKADSMKDILNAMHEFIDHTIVLPPGDWDKELLLPVLRMQNEKMKEKRRQLEEIKELEDTVDLGVAVKFEKKPPEIDPLKRTGRIFGGLINDVKRRYPKYLSDIKDGLNAQCFAAFFFIYFAALSPAITFGGLLGEKSENWMSVSEMMIGSSISGVIFAVFSAQPLTIIGATGPILVFEENLYQFCVNAGIEYLPYRACVGLWLFVIVTIVVAFEGSTLVRYFTRFTEEIFAFLISLIFIYEVFNKLLRIFQAHPLEETYCFEDEYNGTTAASYVMYTEFADNLTDPFDKVTSTPVCSSGSEEVLNQPNTALLSTILMLGTFFLAYFLKVFRNSGFLGKGMRKTIGDFGIPISIICMCLLDFLIQPTYTEKLDVPSGLTPTDPCKRGWFINPMGIQQPMGPLLMLSGVLPALLAFILMYMETLITGLIINKKEHRLKKGSGFHLDLFILGILAAVNGLFGFPWVWAATVRSVTHVGALTIYCSRLAPGEKARIEGVREQRVTSFLVNLMIGVSIFLAPLLRQVPLAVLFGVFLYMGVSSLNGIQMVARTEMIFMPAKHHPDTIFVRNVSTGRMNLYTIIQLICLAVLWVVKISAAALAFPFFLVLLVPIRLQLPRLFRPEELDALDSAEAEEEEDEDEYQTAHMPV